MKFIKKHISTIVGIIVFILVLVGIYAVKEIFFPNESKAIYGNRLEGIEKVKITEETKTKIKEKLQEKTSSVTVRIAGRIVYITMKTNDGVTLEEAKGLGNSVLEEFTEEQKTYYDIQVLIENETNESQFPIIGYKHHAKTAIVWTKDRAGN